MLGLILIVVGVLALAYQGFTYVSKDKVLDAGPVEITAERDRYVYLPPIVGAVLIGAGVVITLTGKKGTV